MADFLLISTTPGRPLEFRLKPPGPLTLGRRSDSTMHFPDRAVSRRHARLDWIASEMHWRISSEPDTLGTSVNGVRLPVGGGLTLRRGDVIGIPNYEFRLVEWDGSTKRAPLGEGDSAVTALAVPDATALAQDMLVTLLRASESMRAASSVQGVWQDLAQGAVSTAGFDGASVLRDAGAGTVEVLATKGSAEGSGSYSRTMVRRALAGETVVGDPELAIGSDIQRSLSRIAVEQAVCMPLPGAEAGGPPQAILWLESVRRMPADTLTASTSAAAVLGRMAAMSIAAVGRAEIERRLVRERELMFSGTMSALVRSIDAKDPYTRGHSDRVAEFARLLAEARGLAQDIIDRSHLCGTVHDIGKIGVPESVLCKPGRLSDEEYALMREHPTIGHRILSDIPQMHDILPGVLQHHERWDGNGYPGRVEGESISLLGRIVCVADCFDAMTSARVYRPARPVAEVLQEIERCAGTHFDPALAEAFARIPLAALESIVAPPPAPPEAGGAG